MEIGGWRLSSLDTGRFRLDGGAMFGVVPKVLWERTNPPDERNRISLALRGLLIEGHGRRIVVDPGIGEKWDRKLVDIYGIDHSQRSLSGALRKAGLTEGDVTDVVISHLHFDHVGGATRWGANGRAELTFPNARYYVHERNLTHAHAPTPKDRASFLEHTIRPLLESGRLEAVGDDHELAPGVGAWVTDGHTPGQLLVHVRGPEGNLLFCGDTIPTASHVPVPYVMAYDLQPLVTMEEKGRILSRAAAEGWVLFWVHDPFVAAGTVRRDGDRYLRAEDVDL